jgi:DNA-binding response OmpR family regulator
MKGNILVIEDDQETADLLERLFKAGGYSVQTSGDGENGVTKACKNQPDLVILDVMMPGMDGFDTCSRIKQNMNIPVLMLSARNGLQDLTRGFNAGADDYVKKPYNSNELLLRVKALVHRYHVNGYQ